MEDRELQPGEWLDNSGDADMTGFNQMLDALLAVVANCVGRLTRRLEIEVLRGQQCKAPDALRFWIVNPNAVVSLSNDLQGFETDLYSVYGFDS